jgi:hypothetical protein
MIKLNERSTEILTYLFDKCENLDEVEVQSQGNPNLLIAKYGHITTSEGDGETLSIGIISDRYRNTFFYRMDFIVYDNRKKTENGGIHAYVYYFQDNNNDVYEYGCLVVGRKAVIEFPKIHESMTKDATKWLLDLVTDGYITV